jgi:hypothetical protein
MRSNISPLSHPPHLGALIHIILCVVFSVGQQIVESNKLFAEHKLPMVAVHSNLDDYVSLVHSEVQRCALTDFHPHSNTSHLRLRV